MNEHKPTSQLNIKDPEVRELAREIAEGLGVTLTEAVREALRDKAIAVRRLRTREERIEALLAHGRWYSQLPNRDTRTAEEILGYDENGLPT